jgi:ribosomal protein S18 acetylase RimI-like enzyme
MQRFEQLQLVKPSAANLGALTDFFARFAGSEEASQFHPHPFTPEMARAVCENLGKDVYCIATLGGVVIGYAMLRGWDHGFEVPSLGICVDSEVRGFGLGRAIMYYLHAEARRRKAQKIRLKVYPGNRGALALYRSLGYVFSDALEQDQLVGYLELQAGRASSHDQ